MTNDDGFSHCRRRARAALLQSAALAFGLTSAWLALPAHAAPVQVAEAVFVLADTFEAGRQPDGNSVVFAGPAGLVVVDTGRHSVALRWPAIRTSVRPGHGR